MEFRHSLFVKVTTGATKKRDGGRHPGLGCRCCWWCSRVGVVGGAQTHQMYSLEFEERGLSIWVFVRTWNRDRIRWDAVSILGRFSMDVTWELSVLTSGICAIEDVFAVVAVFGRFHVLAETYLDYLGNGYRKKLNEYPVVHWRLLKQCLQKVSSSTFGNLNPFSMAQFIVTRLKRVEQCDWMMSKSSLRRSIITGEITMPSVVEVVAKIVDVWSLIVSYLKETNKQRDGDNLVVYFFDLLQFMSYLCLQ